MDNSQLIFVPTKDIKQYINVKSLFGDLQSGAIKLLLMEAVKNTNSRIVEFCSDGIILEIQATELDVERSLEKVSTEDSPGVDLEIERFLPLSAAERMNEVGKLGFRAETLILDRITNQRTKLSGDLIISAGHFVMVDEGDKILYMASATGGVTAIYKDGLWAKIK